MRIFGSAITASIIPLANAVADWMGCDYRQFCTRHRDYLTKELAEPQSLHEFELNRDSLIFEGARLTGSLKRSSPQMEEIADELEMSMWLYQDGISRVTINEPGS